jgi:hypothetical protein
MGFKLLWAAAPAEEVHLVSLTVAFSSPNMDPIHQTEISFEGPSQVRGLVIDLARHPHGKVTERPFSDFTRELRSPDFEPPVVNVDALIRAENGTARFGLRNLFANDTLHILAVSPTLFLGNVHHGPRFFSTFAAPEPCIATCADGTAGQGCVTCMEGSITVKVCC